MALTALDYAAMLDGLMPRGPAWNDALVALLLSAWSEEFARLDVRIHDLVDEADPRTAVELLDDWERVLGLPDECTASLELSVGERQRLAWAKLVEVGGQSAAYFIALAERYGEPGVTIEHRFRQMTCNDDCNDALYSEADRFAWRVKFPHPAANLRIMNCNDDCNDALQMYALSLAECPLSERKPAHTNVIFSYQD